jgi:GTP pyrophosphokinase
MQAKKMHIEEIFDVLAIRVIVKETELCYRILGIVHAQWRPVPGRIKDYIAFPKSNGYRGLHTTIFTGDGSVVEVQIRTEEMHKESEYGIASHLSYKGNKEISESMNWVNHLLPKKNKLYAHRENTSKDVPTWIKELVEHHASERDNEKFSEGLKSDFFERRIFVFTPHGDVVDLPTGSTPVDFAYTIHSNIGDHMAGAKINGKMISLDKELQNGDIVEIITKPSAKPSRKWLDYAKTTMTKRHIRSAIQKLKK